MVKKEIVKSILRDATRAPSTHNSQPWLFKIKEDGVDVFLNPKYFLPFADKENRGLYTSIGCMLENLKISALNSNLETKISYNFQNENNEIAKIKLSPKENDVDTLSKKLFETIPTRVNARGIFKKEIIKSELISEIKSLQYENDLTISFINNRKEIDLITKSTQEGIKEAYQEVGFRKEMSHWMNSNISSKKEGLPGHSLKMPFLISFIIPIFIRYFNIGKLISKLSSKSINSSPLIIIISGKDDKNSWIKVGMLSERIMLYLQSFGYQTSIYVGSIEIGNHYQDIKQITRISDRPQFLFAVGHISGKHKITPRHNIEDKLIN